MALRLNREVPVPTPSLFSVTYTAQRLGVCGLTIRRAIRDGEIACVRIRNKVLVPLDAILRIEQGK